MVEGVGDGLLDLFLQLLVAVDAFLALSGNFFTDGLRGGLTIAPAGPTVVRPCRELGSKRQRQVGLPHLACAVEIVPGRIGPSAVTVTF
jgi:hypothetical protein